MDTFPPPEDPPYPDRPKIQVLRESVREIIDYDEYWELGDFAEDLGIALFTNHTPDLTLGERTKILLNIMQTFLKLTDTNYLDDVQSKLQTQEPNLYDELRKHPAAPYFFV